MVVLGVGAESLVDCCCEFGPVGPVELANMLLQSDEPSEGLPLKGGKLLVSFDPRLVFCVKKILVFEQPL